MRSNRWTDGLPTQGVATGVAGRSRPLLSCVTYSRSEDGGRDRERVGFDNGKTVIVWESRAINRGINTLRGLARLAGM